MQKVLCFGEIMGRLNPKGHLRIKQAKEYELSFAGGEANVAVSLANFGCEAEFLSKIPKNDLTEALIRDLKGYGVDLSNMVYGGERLGMYYVEKGASQRPSTVIYDRKYSSIATAKSEDFDWDKIFEGITWFHFTGITPALSDNMAFITKEALVKAKEKNITVSCDINYRGKLWTTQKASEVMAELAPYVDVCISNEEDTEKVFGIHAEGTDITSGSISKEGYQSSARQLMERFGFEKVAFTMRGSLSASDNTWAGMLYDGKEFFHSKNYQIHIVDRVGGGDSFAGGLIYALISEYSNQEAIDFAVAASCLKHTVEFDYNQVTIKEVKILMGGDGSGRVQR